MRELACGTAAVVTPVDNTGAISVERFRSAKAIPARW